METPRGPILLVEDDEDTRQFMAVALSVRGFSVHEAASAEEALERLRRQRYALVLTDYDMPGRTGAAMLRQAAAEGVLDGTPSLVITAHPEPVGTEGLDLVRKPVDIDRFLLQVDKILQPAAGGGAPPATAGSADPAPAAERAAPGPGVRIELVLYVSRLSPASLRAQRNMEALLERYDARQVRYEVCDLALRPAEAERDRVIFTPTLVKRSPEPPTWVLGDLSDPSLAMDLLSMCGVETTP